MQLVFAKVMNKKSMKLWDSILNISMFRCRLALRMIYDEHSLRSLDGYCPVIDEVFAPSWP